jgi:hypothetical protein
MGFAVLKVNTFLQYTENVIGNGFVIGLSASPAQNI